MKTIQISDELWKRLRIEAAVKGVTMREVVEGMGRTWVSRRPDVVDEVLMEASARVQALGRELKVEYEEG
jgi:hypothetical protein